MRLFADEKLERIFHTRFAAGLPKHVAISAHEIASLLAASRSLQDVGVIGHIIRLKNAPDRYASHVIGKWHITWNWSPDFGAHEMRLQRL
jgi:addiction module HigA family antidote